MIVYLNGDYVEAAQARLSLFDGGYLFGDGLFDTLRLYGGRPHDLAGHLERLDRQLGLLGYTWRPREPELRRILAELAARNGLRQRDSRARLTVSRGVDPDNPLPLADLDRIAPTVSVFLTPLPASLARDQAEGIGVRIMKAVFARGNFPQLKSLNYLPTIMALRFAAAHGCQEAILVDRRGKILEAATSNVFILRDGRLATPPVKMGLLPGLTRERVIAAGAALGLACDEEAFDRTDLARADEIFLTGSVKEILPVVRVDDAPVADGRPGPRTRALQQRYRQDVQDVLARENAADPG